MLREHDPTAPLRGMRLNIGRPRRMYRYAAPAPLEVAVRLTVDVLGPAIAGSCAQGARKPILYRDGEAYSKRDRDTHTLGGQSHSHSSLRRVVAVACRCHVAQCLLQDAVVVAKRLECRLARHQPPALVDVDCARMHTDARNHAPARWTFNSQRLLTRR
jgi:hypothetical protein